MKNKEYQIKEDFTFFCGRTEELMTFENQFADYKNEWEQFGNRGGNNRRTYLLDVFGMGGVGKTTLLKKMKYNVQNKDENRNIPVIYVDTSGDVGYIDIIAKLRKELSETFQDAEGESPDIHFVLFDLVYKMYFNNYKVQYPVPLQKILLGQFKDFINKIKKILSKEQKFDFQDQDVESILKSLLGKSVTEIFSKRTVYSKYKIIKTLLKEIATGISAVRENRDRKDEIELLENNLENAYKLGKLNSEYMRQKYLLDIFIQAVSKYLENYAVLFIIDNFRYNVNNREVYYDYSWLVSENGLIQSVPAFFVLGERDTIKPALYENSARQINYIPMKLSGLTYDDIKDYYHERCGLFQNDTVNNIEEYMLKAALADDKINYHDNDTLADNRNNDINLMDFSRHLYLPIYMMFAADYYNEVKAKKENEFDQAITVEDLGRIDRINDLYFYFEMNMSDIKRDAFYILSCLDTWKTVWFQRVREKFDNYLLGATHVLGNVSSVEKIDHQELKLHDVVRESLFNSPNNLIKLDVLEWLFLYFLHLQHIETAYEWEFLNDSDERECIDNTGELDVYIHICKRYFEHLQNQDRKSYNRFNGEEASKKFFMAFEKSLDFFDSPETVNEEIIETVKYIIKHFSVFMGNQSQLIQLQNRLEFLYTHASRNLDSLAESMKIYENLLEQYKILPQPGERNIENYIFPLSHINMKKNSVSFDEGAVWEYEKAAKYGTAVVKEQYALMREAVPYLGFTVEEEKAFEGILDYLSPDNSHYDKLAEKNFIKNAEIYKNSDYRKKYAEKWDRDNFKDLFVAYTKARGNIPWFYLRLKKRETREKYYFDNFNPIDFGEKTYIIRKTIYGNIPETFLSKHNVSVYLSKTGKYKEALKKSNEVLNDISLFHVEKKVMTEQEIEEKIQNLVRMDLIPEQDIWKAYHSYQNFLNYISLGIEVLQYNSSYRQRIAEEYREDQEQFEKWMRDALEKGTAALTLRYITFTELNHKNILNSWSYLASYYYYLGKKEIGIKIMQYLLHLHSNGVEIPEEKAREFQLMLQDMQDSVWEEDRRLSEQKI